MTELRMLRCAEKTWRDVALAAGAEKTLDGVVGDSCELELTIDAPATAKQVGVKVRASADGAEETLLYYDIEARQLVFDSTKSGVDGHRGVERAPLELRRGGVLQRQSLGDDAVESLLSLLVGKKDDAS